MREEKKNNWLINTDKFISKLGKMLRTIVVLVSATDNMIIITIYNYFLAPMTCLISHLPSASISAENDVGHSTCLVE